MKYPQSISRLIRKGRNKLPGTDLINIEQAVLLLEIDPPFDKRDIQLARRRLAKQWHPDIAPPGKQLEHERHLKAVNEAAHTLEGKRSRRRFRLGDRVKVEVVRVDINRRQLDFRLCEVKVETEIKTKIKSRKKRQG